MMIKPALLGLMLLVIAAPALARESLGLFKDWAAYRDAAAPRCFAIAQPNEPKTRKAGAYASIGHWPRAELFNQPHFKLSQSAKGASLLVGGTRFPLAVRGRDAWTKDRRADAAVVTAMRRSNTMTIDGMTTAGKSFTDRYALPGVATAVDAAAAACRRKTPPRPVATGG